MSKILKTLIAEYNYLKAQQSQELPVFVKCSYCQKNVLFVKKDSTLVRLVSCLDCFPLAAKIDQLIEEIKDGCFNFDKQTNKFGDYDYVKLALVEVLLKTLEKEVVIAFFKNQEIFKENFNLCPQ
jgi:hypothetical protein